MIELRGLNCGYEEGTLVVRDFTDTFPDGTVTALIGPNGSGKSTLIETVIGLHKKKSGEILIDGEALEALSPRERALRVAYMAQVRPIPSITAEKMVLHGRFPHLSYPRKYRKEDFEIARRCLKAVGAEELAHHYMNMLSGGQRQKVYIAMALAQDTRNLFLDEPMNFLDVGNQLELLRLAKEIAGNGKAVVMVIHDIRAAMEAADRIAVLDSGRLCISASPEEVYRSGAIGDVFHVSLCRAETPSGMKYYYA